MNRRELIKVGAGAAVTGFAGTAASATPIASDGEKVEQWGMFETQASGPSAGNSFMDVSFGARFTLGHRTIDVAGFYDGSGAYKVRFSPDTVGRWSFETTGSQQELAGHTGGFECVEPSAGNHGPVGTAHQFHFQYADATPYFPFGTTCYSYGFIGAPLDQETLTNLKEAGFNKVRICLLPKPLGQMKLPAMPFERVGVSEPRARRICRTAEQAKNNSI